MGERRERGGREEGERGGREEGGRRERERRERGGREEGERREGEEREEGERERGGREKGERREGEGREEEERIVLLLLWALQHVHLCIRVKFTLQKLSCAKGKFTLQRVIKFDSWGERGTGRERERWVVFTRCLMFKAGMLAQSTKCFPNRQQVRSPWLGGRGR